MKCALGCRWDARVGLICGPHRDHLADLLDPRQRGDVFVKPGERRTPPSIPVLYLQLSAERGRREPGPTGPTAFGPSSPADDAAIVLRDPRSHAEVAGPDDSENAPWAVPAVLQALALRTMTERGRPEVMPPLTVEGLSGWLHGSVDYIAGRLYVMSAYRNLRALSATLRAALGDPPPSAVGTCRAPVDDDGHETPTGPWRCAVPLYMPEMPPRAPDEPIQLPTLRCSSCGHRYTGAELVQLGHHQHQPIAS